MMAEVNDKIFSDKIALLTECSWEVCNKIGGIYTVLSTKAVELKKIFGDNLVFIGPDLGQGTDLATGPSLFKERKTLLKSFAGKKLPHDIKVRVGRWTIPGSPIVILVDFSSIYPLLNDIYGEMWRDFSVDSLHAYGDYNESCAFAIASAIVSIELGRHLKVAPEKQMAHYDEWTTGMGLLYMKKWQPETATIFTTHATTIGRSICGNGKALYRYFENYDGDQMAQELNVESKHSLEKAASWNADCFTTVSDVTSRECRQLLGRSPDVVTPNGFEPSFVPEAAKWEKMRMQGRCKLLRIASLLNDAPLPEDTFIVATSGRNEYRNKGLDLFLESMFRLADKAAKIDRKVLALILVPGWVSQPSGDLLVNLEFGGWIRPEPDYLTHRLNNEATDALACGVRNVSARISDADIHERLKLILIPSYLDGNDGIVNISYYDLLPAIDMTVFGSYYEPWGYTPLESVAFGIPTVTTDKAGFGEWVRSIKADNLKKDGVAVIDREDTNFDESAERIADIVIDFMRSSDKIKIKAGAGAITTARKAEWKFFINNYKEAFEVALANAAKRREQI